MHYHYFTIEQREALKEVLSSRAAEQPALRSELERLRTPEYGICEACGADIPFARLYADPSLRLCGRCHG